MSGGNTIRVMWDFDLENNSELREEVGLTEGEVYEEIASIGEEGYNRKIASIVGVPSFVNLDLFFDDPREASSDEIIDALSEEYRWLIKRYEYV